MMFAGLGLALLGFMVCGVDDDLQWPTLAKLGPPRAIVAGWIICGYNDYCLWKGDWYLCDAMHVCPAHYCLIRLEP